MEILLHTKCYFQNLYNILNEISHGKKRSLRDLCGQDIDTISECISVVPHWEKI